jgi:hypothetical protein
MHPLHICCIPYVGQVLLQFLPLLAAAALALSPRFFRFLGHAAVAKEPTCEKTSL